jgi:hypothetical protein
MWTPPAISSGFGNDRQAPPRRPTLQRGCVAQDGILRYLSSTPMRPNVAGSGMWAPPAISSAAASVAIVRRRREEQGYIGAA